MSRHLVLAVIAGSMLATVGPDLSACGDKFLLVGRSLRYKQAFASAHPSSIVAYAPPGSPVRELMKDQGFAALLAFAGHNVRVVEAPAALAKALAGGRVDVVLADVQNGPELQRGIAQERSRPLIAPIVFNASKSAGATIERQYGCAIRMPARAVDALAAVEEAVKLHDRQAR
jgi:hypothetical protein